ncbi:three-Cys-motif partner protein TcmP [Chloroflexota bacterium]
MVLRYDRIGSWSTIKIEIVENYARAYSQILSNKGFYPIYIDAFAGSGRHISKDSGDYILGTPQVVLNIDKSQKLYGQRIGQASVC